MAFKRASDTNRNSPKPLERRPLIKGVHIVQVLGAILLALNLLLGYAVFFGAQGIPGYRLQCRQVDELEAKVRRMKEENHRLFSRIQGFKSSPKAQERLVREQLGWARENELVIEFVSPGDKSH